MTITEFQIAFDLTPDGMAGDKTKAKMVDSLKLLTNQQSQIINELQPKATYYDLILQSSKPYQSA
jgi:hypothetical protein